MMNMCLSVKLSRTNDHLTLKSHISNARGTVPVDSLCSFCITKVWNSQPVPSMTHHHRVKLPAEEGSSGVASDIIVTNA